ncbi:hypothetical protein AWC17_17700 [Mycobacterium nebraskense]|uniref:Uncharacterized protein n=1 Tax=Mycobacterium nebraskense TaxID=244292 RepID=A0A1X1YW28_9MYCO|nr:hypothetical protein AWC17_17700 [Mycobacterium nebraskense]
MRGIVCAVCGAGFSARSDAVYCSSACRQKAHRARTARRTAVLRETLRRSSGMGRGTYSDSPRSPEPSVASSIQRARQQLDRTRELCRVSELRLQESDAIRQAALEKWAARSAATMSDTERALWRGN